MTGIRLTFHERIALWSMIGNYQAPNIRSLSVMLRLIEKVRPTDEEMQDTMLIAKDQTLSWKMPDPRYGERMVGLEAEEAAALVTVFESLENVRVSDGAWICRLMESLLAATAMQAA